MDNQEIISAPGEENYWPGQENFIGKIQVGIFTFVIIFLI